LGLWRAARDPAFQPAGTIRRTDPAALRVVIDHVVGLRAVTGRVRESVAKLDTFDRLYAGHRRRQAPVETLVPLAIRAQPYGQPICDDFEHTTQRIARGPCCLDRLHGLGFELGVAAAYGRLFHALPPCMR